MSLPNDPPPPFRLTDGERQSQIWFRIREHLEQKLVNARGKLEGNQTEIETADHRGQIRLLKSLIALGDPPPNTDG